MSTSPTSESGIHVEGSKSVSYAGRSGTWQPVHVEDLPRVPLADQEPSDAESNAVIPGTSTDQVTESLSSPMASVEAVVETASANPVLPGSAVNEFNSPDPVVAESDVAEPEIESANTNGSAVNAKGGESPKLELKRRQQLEHHLKSNPTDLESFLELGRIYRAENRPIEARRVLQQAMQIFPDEKELLWEFEEATLSRSLQQLREVTDLATRLKTAETERELSRCQQDWAMRRIEVCQSRLGRDPSMINLKVALGEAKYDAGMYEEAADVLESVLISDEYSPVAYLITGKCWLALGKDLEAMAAFRACALRRAVPAPVRTRVIALRLLCETADRLGIALTLAHYRSQLQHAEQELAKKVPLGS